MKNQQITPESAVKTVNLALSSGIFRNCTAKKKLLFHLLNFQHYFVEFQNKYYTLCKVIKIVENSVEKVKKPFIQREYFVKN